MYTSILKNTDFRKINQSIAINPTLDTNTFILYTSSNYSSNKYVFNLLD